MILFGSLLIVITIDDAMMKNTILRTVGAVFIFLGTNILHRQFHPNEYNK